MAKTDVAVELFYSGLWNDITSADEVYTRDPITITRGRPDESQRITPSTLKLTLDNRDGRFSPRNPMSPLYGLIGRNTPIRVSMRLVKDGFNRTTASTWGTSESGHVWAGANAALSTTGTAARWTHTASGGVFNTLNNSGGQVDVVAQSTMRIGTKLTGSGAVYPQMLLRFQDSANYYTAGLFYQASGTPTASVGLVLAKVVGGSQSSFFANFSFDVYNGSETFNLKSEVVGTTIRIKAWRTTVSEPAAWTYETTDATFSSGSFAVLSRKDATITSVNPTIDMDDLSVRSYRFTGEVESWPQRWAVKGDAWTPITANGILRRLNAPGTTKPAWSPLRRAITATNPLAYWPLEESSQAPVLASGLATGQPMVFGTLPPLLGNETLAPGAVSGVDVGNEGTATGLLTGGSNGSWSVLFIANFLRRDSDLVNVMTIQAGGIRAQALMGLSAVSGTLTGPANAVSLTGAQIAATNPGNRRPHQVVFSATQSGGNATVTLTIDGVLTGTDTLTGVTVVPPTNVTINGDPVLTADTLADGTQLVIGHIAVYDSIFSTNLANPIAAWAGESAADRLTRLASEENVSLSYVGNTSDTELVGVQRTAPALELMYDATDADGGILYESRENLGLIYRTRKSLYNQSAVLTANYSAGGEVAPPLEPTEDTDVTANDVTVTRYQGGFANVVQTSGPLNVLEPTADINGVGRYKKDFTLVLADNSQCVQAASWIKHLGTWDEARYPVVNLDPTAMVEASKLNLIGPAAGLDIGDRVSITNPPSWLPPDSIVQNAQGFTEVLGSHHWTIAVNATPALPYDVLRLETDTSSNLSRIPTGASTLDEAATSGQTRLVVTSVTTRWIDSINYAAQFPFDIIVSGERIRVTASANYLNSNPYFESTASPWTTQNGATAVRSTAQFHEGAASLLITPDGVSFAPQATSEEVAAVAGRTYTVSGWIRSTGAATRKLGLFWYDASHVQLSSNEISIALSAGVWTQFGPTGFVAPANTAFLRIFTNDPSNPLSSNTWFLDEATVSSGNLQVFTTTRSINGIVKTQASGADVQLFRPPRIAR